MGRLRVPWPTPLLRHELEAARWSAGFGPSCAPYLANVEATSFRTCRRRITEALRQHGRLLAITPAARAAFEAAERLLRDVPAGEAWSHTVRVDQFDLTFWVLDDAEAHRRGAVAKR